MEIQRHKQTDVTRSVRTKQPESGKSETKNAPHADNEKTETPRSKRGEEGGDFGVITVDTSKARNSHQVVRKCIRELGWKEVTTERKYKSCDIYWQGFFEDNTSITTGAINKFPAMSSMMHKIFLFKALDFMKSLWPEEYNFYPKTWSLPQEYRTFCQTVRESQQTNPKYKPTFIVKPDIGSQGRGIYLLRDPQGYDANSKENHVAQEYLKDVYTVDGFKFDLRVYCVIRSLHPLQVYICKEGLARFSTLPYTKPTKENINETFMHLTNYSLNKKSETFIRSEKGGEGSKRNMTSVLKTMAEAGCDVDGLWKNIEKMVCKTLIAVLPHLHVSCHLAFPVGKKPLFSQILGFDILIMKNLKPMLLEVNSGPSLSICHEIETSPGIYKNVISRKDEEIKYRLVRDALILLAPKSKLKLNPVLRKRPPRKDKSEQHLLDNVSLDLLTDRTYAADICNDPIPEEPDALPESYLENVCDLITDSSSPVSLPETNDGMNNNNQNPSCTNSSERKKHPDGHVNKENQDCDKDEECGKENAIESDRCKQSEDGIHTVSRKATKHNEWPSEQQHQDKAKKKHVNDGTSVKVKREQNKRVTEKSRNHLHNTEQSDDDISIVVNAHSHVYESGDSDTPTTEKQLGRNVSNIETQTDFRETPVKQFVDVACQSDLSHMTTALSCTDSRGTQTVGTSEEDGGDKADRKQIFRGCINSNSDMTAANSKSGNQAIDPSLHKDCKTLTPRKSRIPIKISDKNVSSRRISNNVPRNCENLNKQSSEINSTGDEVKSSAPLSSTGDGSKNPFNENVKQSTGPPKARQSSDLDERFYTPRPQQSTSNCDFGSSNGEISDSHQPNVNASPGLLPLENSQLIFRTKDGENKISTNLFIISEQREDSQSEKSETTRSTIDKDRRSSNQLDSNSIRTHLASDSDTDYSDEYLTESRESSGDSTDSGQYSSESITSRPFPEQLEGRISNSSVRCISTPQQIRLPSLPMTPQSPLVSLNKGLDDSPCTSIVTRLPIINKTDIAPEDSPSVLKIHITESQIKCSKARDTHKNATGVFSTSPRASGEQGKRRANIKSSSNSKGLQAGSKPTPRDRKHDGKLASKKRNETKKIKEKSRMRQKNTEKEKVAPDVKNTANTIVDNADNLSADIQNSMDNELGNANSTMDMKVPERLSDPLKESDLEIGEQSNCGRENDLQSEKEHTGQVGSKSTTRHTKEASRGSSPHVNHADGDPTKPTDLQNVSQHNINSPSNTSSQHQNCSPRGLLLATQEDEHYLDDDLQSKTDTGCERSGSRAGNNRLIKMLKSQQRKGEEDSGSGDPEDENCLEEIYQNKYGVIYDSLRITEKFSEMFIQFLGIVGSQNMGPSGFRMFVRKCKFSRKGVSSATLDIIYSDYQRKYSGNRDTTGICYRAFVDICYEIAKRRFWSQSKLEMTKSFLSYCDDNLQPIQIILPKRSLLNAGTSTSLPCRLSSVPSFPGAKSMGHRRPETVAVTRQKRHLPTIGDTPRLALTTKREKSDLEMFLNNRNNDLYRTNTLPDIRLS